MSSNTITTKKESAEWLFVSPSLQKEQETNIFQNKTTFKIKVLTPLVAYSGPATSQAAKEDPEILSNSGVDSVYLFKGRIMDNRMAHVSFLEDPCDTSIANSPQAEVVGALHSNILLSNVGEMPNISVGDIVYGELDTGNSNLYNLQYVNMTSVSDVFKVEDVSKKLESCYDLKSKFESNWVGRIVGGPIDPTADPGSITGLAKELAVPTGGILEGSFPNPEQLTLLAETEIGIWTTEGEGLATIRARKGDEYARGLLSKYWATVGWADNQWVPDGAATPWSAAFISYVVFYADNTFTVSASHYYYALAAAKEIGNWTAWRLSKSAKIRPQIGDIFVRSREDANNPTAGHGDVVYKIEGDKVFLAGGNINARGLVSTAGDAVEFRIKEDGTYDTSKFGSYIIILKKYGNIFAE